MLTLNNCTSAASPFALTARRFGNIINISGNVSISQAIAAYSTIFTTPGSGYRPKTSYVAVFRGEGDNGIMADIRSNGSVQCHTALNKNALVGINIMYLT